MDRLKSSSNFVVTPSMLPALVAFRAKAFFFCHSSWISLEVSYLTSLVSDNRDHFQDDVAVLDDSDVVLLVAETGLYDKVVVTLVGATVKATS
jgi:hypothetical protein